jgi:hypothetical protein
MRGGIGREMKTQKNRTEVKIKFLLIIYKADQVEPFHWAMLYVKTLFTSVKVSAT